MTPGSPRPDPTGSLPSLDLLAFLSGGDELTRRVRDFDWASTSLGPIESWPQSLKTATAILLRSPVPIVMLWGEDGVMIYNAAYSVFAGGRHPRLLGSKVREGWPEVADFNDNVMKVGLAGGTLAFKDQELTLHRSGAPEQVWMDLDYSPVPGEDGRPAGVIAIVIETTERVLAERSRQEAENALRAERDRARDVLENMGDAFSLMDRDFRILDVNKEAMRLETRPREAIVGRSQWEAYPGVEDSEIGALYKRAVAERVPVGLVHRYTWEDGRNAWLDMRAYPVEDGLAVFYRDVTEAKRAEEALRASEARLEAVADSVDQMIWSTRPDGFHDYFNARWYAYTGVPEGSTDGEAWNDLFHPDDQERAWTRWRHSLETGEFYEIEYRLRHRSGEYRWVIGRARPWRDEEGRITRWYGTCTDIHDLKTAEDALRESEARYRTLFEAIDVGFCIVEMKFDEDRNPIDYRLAEINPAFERQTGLHGAAGKWVSEAAPGLERHWFETYGRVALTGQAVRFENEAVPLGRWYDVHAFRTGEPDEHRVAILFNDISERRRAELALRRLNNTLEHEVAERTAERDRMWETSPHLLLVIDFDGVFRRVNPAWTTLLGYTPEELVGRHVNEFVLPDDHRETTDAYERAAEGGRPRIENRYRHKDGSVRWISWVAAPAGDVTYATGRDVTAEKQRQAELEAAQDALRQAQKMEAVGQLTGGIAHDFNNMLAVVIGSLDLLGRRLGDGDARARRYVDAAAEGARRAATLTQRLLAFSRQQPLKPEPVDVNKLVAGMSDLLRHSLGGDARLETVLAGGLWRTHADPNQLENAILNLAVNARDAMPEGGRLTIETQNAHLDERYVSAHLGVPAGQYVLIAVTDTGDGMAADVAAKAFDPFFTTKAVGKGTGLGLSQVYGFVKQSGGHVKIYSEPGQGTTVKVYLPRLIGTEGEGAVADDASDLPLGEQQEVVLVVEDEPAVRQFSVDALTELGYRVLEADGAASAFRVLDAHPEIALLFTDVVMPDVNGARLAEEARRRRPDLKVLFTTGYTRNAVVHNGVLDPGVELIGKPFTVEQLAAKVRAVLDGGG